jgi:hypothetical protein
MANEKPGPRRPARTDLGKSGSPNCSRKGCGKSAKSVVALKIYCEGCEKPAEVFATIYACSDEHRAPDSDIGAFFTHNWEKVTVGFMQHGVPRPIRELTEFSWVDIEDYEEYLRQHAGAAPGSTKVTRVH